MNKDYENRLMASIAYTLNQEARKNLESAGININKFPVMTGRRVKENYEEQRPLHEIIEDRMNEDGNPKLERVEAYALIKEVNMLIRFIKDNLEKDDYKIVAEYSRRTVKECELLGRYTEEMGMMINGVKETMQEALKKAEIMVNNPEKGKVMIALEKAVEQERYEDAARLRDTLNKL